MTRFQHYNAAPPAGRWTSPAVIFALIFIILAAGVVSSGYYYYRSYESRFRAAAEQQLAAIAELKVGELVQYRRERLGDAAIIDNNPAFAQLVRRAFALPADDDARRQLQVWLDKFQIHFQYERVFLLDAHGKVRMTAPEPPGRVAAVILARATEVL